ncbi:unnamed protein product [Schistosoma rodhaini]|nr:unnamed protein product [Schistosoma rodhaini]
MITLGWRSSTKFKILEYALFEEVIKPPTYSSHQFIMSNQVVTLSFDILLIMNDHDEHGLRNLIEPNKQINHLCLHYDTYSNTIINPFIVKAVTNPSCVSMEL